MAGQLTVYLGAAPGVGKTFAMLNEAHRRQARGTDVVIALVETHGRAQTAELMAGIEVVPRQTIEYRGTVQTEMDVQAVLDRRPEVALVDELAHTNVPGAKHEKRWQDVEDLLAADIDVVTTVNVQHLESLNDVVKSITGVRQRETVPDEMVRAADQIQLVDMTPEGLRRRLAHGNVYPSDRIDASLSSYFRLGNLTALRELALLWLADRVDEALTDYRAAHRIDESWPARERIVVAITGGPEGEVLVRRAAQVANRGRGADLLAVHVIVSDGLVSATPAQLTKQRALVESLGGSFHAVVGDDVATAVVDFAKGANATIIMIGVSRRPRWQAAVAESAGVQIARLAGSIDVQLISHAQGRAAMPRPRRFARLGVKRTVAGWLTGLLGPVLLSAAMHACQGSMTFTAQLMLFLTLIVVVAIIGGLWPALTCAVLGTLLLNFLFAEPVGTFSIADPENVLGLVVFIVVALAVSSVVDIAARRTAQARRAQAEAATLASLTGVTLRGDGSPSAVVEQLRETFGLRGVSLLRRGGHRRPWQTIATAGAEPALAPEDGTETVMVADPEGGDERAEALLVVTGAPLDAADRRVLESFGAQLGAMLERRRLRLQAGQAAVLERSEAIQSALLTAVSHDLRTPLAAIRTAVDGLRLPDVDWSPEDEDDLLETIDDSTTRLEGLIANLLDLSRLRAGAVRPALRAVSLDEVVPAAVEGLPHEAIRLDVPEASPLAWTDRGLLERVVANVVSNAVRHSAGEPVTIAASATDLELQLRVVDRGPGVDDAKKSTMFEPFQQLGDSSPTGLGLGLAVARGLADAVGATVVAEDTPGGGLTMVITVPRADAVPAAEGNPSADNPAPAGFPRHVGLAGYSARVDDGVPGERGEDRDG